MTEENIKQLRGLSTDQVVKRQVRDGFNELLATQGGNLWATAWDVLTEPMLLILVVCGIIYLLMGDRAEAILLLGFVLVMIGITIFQRRKTERALEALKDLSSPRALVIRNGQQTRIAGREVVCDDIVILNEGDRVPADGIVMWERNLSVDESLLTGESIPVKKVGDCVNRLMEQPGGDQHPFIYSGTMVVAGQGVVWIKAIGNQTELGKIGKSLQSVVAEKTLLQTETDRIVRLFSLIGGVLCAIIVIAYGLLGSGWMNGFLAGISFAMAMLPEEFPVVLTIFLAIGALRISYKHVLTRKMTAVETLGAASVLCVDKTGTLTQNRMTIQQLFAVGSRKTDLECVTGETIMIPEQRKEELPAFFHELIEYGILASKKDPFDPMEKALLDVGARKLVDREHLHQTWALIHEYPLSRELLSLSHVWKTNEAGHTVVAAKGAPEAIADLCHFSCEQITALQEKIQQMASQGLRLLGVAKAVSDEIMLPEQQHDFVFEFLGLIGLADPVRVGVPEAIQDCYQAGIKVVMITGDYAGTAITIGKSIGLRQAECTLTGQELNLLSPVVLQQRVKDLTLFSRVVPEQKLMIVNAFKANGDIVAMTGDGVNDAPALKSAHIGIAMGGRGTDVAREASDLVLLDDNFTSIVAAVKMGRRIFENLKKAVAYIIAVHVPIAGLSLIPVIFQWPLILYPVHIVFLELIIDPACSIVFEAEPAEVNSMNNPPRLATESLFSTKTVIFSVLQGLVVLVVVLVMYKLALSHGFSITEARGLTFSTLIFANIALILTNRSWRLTTVGSLKVPNPALWWVIASALIFLGVVLYVPFASDLFKLSPIHAKDILIAVGCAAASVIWFEIIKVLFLRRIAAVKV